MIHKSFLRILAFNALSHKQGNQYATIAEDRIYDTELDDLDSRNDGNELEPRILIYTENSEIGFGRQNANSFASYANVKLKIELVVFGACPRYNQYNNVNKLLAIVSDVFEQQVFDALFKAQNEHAQKFRDFIVFSSNLQSNNVMDSDSDKKIFVKSIEFDVQLPEQYNSSVYPQDRINIFDYYPDYVNLIPIGMRNELEKILAMNDATKLEIVNSKIQTNDAPLLTIQNEFNDD